MRSTLEQLPHGVVLISGTNGKTTTTKMVSQLLRESGLKVFTNRTGSNFTRGVAAALLEEVDNQGCLPFDIAVLELDEAYAAHFVRQVAPRYSLILNVMRDQLDRFGEIDHTAKLLTEVANRTTEAVILNRDDPRVARIAHSVNPDVTVKYFGASVALRSIFVNDDELHTPADQLITTAALPRNSTIELTEVLQHTTAVFSINGKTHKAKMQLTGTYNYLNAAGALALCFAILGDKAETARIVSALSTVTPAFGRGEVLQVKGLPLELILVKNPAGFRLALSSFDPAGTDVMIAINDQYADGRDMSWLWDVDFSGLAGEGVQAVSGIRAFDMALRLQYDDVAVGKVSTDMKQTLTHFIVHSRHRKRPMRIFCTYTAMLQLRKLLKYHAKVERI